MQVPVYLGSKMDNSIMIRATLFANEVNDDKCSKCVLVKSSTGKEIRNDK